MKKPKLFTLLAVMLFTASITNVAMGQVRSIVVQTDNTSTYQPTQIENGSFNDQPWMDYQVWDENWGEWKWVSDRNEGYAYNNRSINQANPHGVNEGWNTSESVVQDGTLFEWLEQETINEWSQGGVWGCGYGIEMNAKSSAVLYQDLSTKGYDIIRWSLKHAVRCDYGPNTQSMKVEIGAPEYSGSDIVPAYGINESVDSHIQSSTKAIYTSSGISGSYGSDGENLSGLSLTMVQNDKWYDVRGVYMVPAGQEVTRFAFIATSPLDEWDDEALLSGGNFLDEITFSTLIGNLSAVQLANGDVELKGYWGETDDSKKLKVVIGSTYNIDMSEVVGENFKITIPSTTIGDATSLTVYHQDYYAARRTIDIHHSYSQSITAATNDENGWYLISSPLETAVSPSNVNNMTSNQYDIFRFDQSAELEWQNWSQTGGHYQFNLESGRGYLYANNQDVELTFIGTPYSGNGEISLSYSDDNPETDMRGWNLIGNPFGVSATIAQAFYRMNEETHSDLIAGFGDIAPMEGIFVYRDENGPESVTFTPSGAKRSERNENHIVINLSGNNGAIIDRAIVSFDNGYTLPKFQISEYSTKLYFPQNGKDYAIAYSDREGPMPLNFKVAKNGSYTLTVDTKSAEMAYLHLIDNIAGADIDLLAQPSYTFTTQITDYTSRFKLVFDANGNDNENEDFAFNSNGQIIVTGSGVLHVFDVLGRTILVKELSLLTTQFSSLNYTPGVYVLQLVNGTDIKTQKIIVK